MYSVTEARSCNHHNSGEAMGITHSECVHVALPVVLYGCETWSLPLREGRRLRVLESRVLRRIFGPKRDEVTGE
jgi:hypothetical protein